MELHQLRAFVHIVDCGAFGKAAEELHVTQAAISHAIKSLEGRVGATLLNRRNGVLSLTESGLVLLPHARSVLASIDAASGELAALKEEGTLRIATFASSSAHYLSGMMRWFRQNFLRMKMDILEGNDVESMSWLKSGKVDIAFVVGPATDVEFHPVYDDDFVLVATERDFPARTGSALPLSKLDGTSLIEPTGGCGHTVKAALSASGISVKQGAVARETSTALALVEANIGVAVLPRLLVTNLPEGLTAHDLVPRISRTIGLAVRPGERRPYAVTSLLALVEKLNDEQEDLPRSWA